MKKNILILLLLALHTLCVAQFYSSPQLIVVDTATVANTIGKMVMHTDSSMYIYNGNAWECSSCIPPALQVSYDTTGTSVLSTNVQNAITELASDISLLSLNYFFTGQVIPGNPGNGNTFINNVDPLLATSVYISYKDLDGDNNKVALTELDTGHIVILRKAGSFYAYEVRHIVDMSNYVEVLVQSPNIEGVIATGQEVQLGLIYHNAISAITEIFVDNDSLSYIIGLDTVPIDYAINMHFTAIYANCVLKTDHAFTTVNVPEPLICDTTLSANGVIPSVGGVFETTVSGYYNFTAFPNFFKTSGGQEDVLVYVEIDKGVGWVAEVFSGTVETIMANTNNMDVAYYYEHKAIFLDTGWKIRFMASVSNLNITLMTIPATGGVPGTPSNIITLQYIGQ